MTRAIWFAASAVTTCMALAGVGACAAAGWPAAAFALACVAAVGGVAVGMWAGERPDAGAKGDGK